MQQQQDYENGNSSVSFQNEDMVLIQQLINLLKNKRRKEKPAKPQNGDDEDGLIDTLLEVKEIGSHMSSLSSNKTHQTFISIHITDYDAKNLQIMLENLLKEVLYQQMEKEKIKKAYSDLQQEYQSQIIEQKKHSNSDVVQAKKQQDFQEDEKSSKSKVKQSQSNKKTLNPKQILKSLKELNQKYQKYLNQLLDSKVHNNSNILINQLRHKVSKFKEQHQNMNEEIEILQECESIFQDNYKILQKHAQELEGLNIYFGS